MAVHHSSSEAPGGESWSRDPGSRESDIRLKLPARPESIAVVRHVLSALAEALDVPHAVIDDIRLAVTEACTNVVRHAYTDGDGTIDVAVTAGGQELEVVVADEGRGIGPSPDTRGPGFGLALMEALSDSLQVERRAGAGSRFAMSFLRTRTPLRLA
jgi:anti-sigma regulatory factor (Ser/Thr protein kinase)